MTDRQSGEAALEISHVDDPHVVEASATEDYSTHIVPLTGRAGRGSLSMAWWAMFSAMFWLYIAVSVTQTVGTADAVAGMVLSALAFGGVNYVLSRYAGRTGLTVALLSRRLFGYFGAILAPLLFAATAIYYAVFEGSVIAIALQRYIAPGSDIRIWYAVVVVYALPLVIGGVQAWLDKLNGWLLPLYVAGLVALVIGAGVQHGFSGKFLSLPAAASVPGIPGWLWAFCIYMGVWIMMMYTVDYSRLGKRRDNRFHGAVTFGPVFYLATFVVNGLVGIFAVTAALPGQAASETGVVDAILNTLGFAGLLLVIVSQTRINTANYYLASSNLEAFGSRALKLRWPRLVWVVVAGLIIYSFMLTDVLSYLLTALAWQGVFVVAWVSVALTHIALARDDRHGVPEFRPGRLRSLLPGVVAWVIPSVAGILLTEFGTPGSWYVTITPLLTFVFAAVLYAAALRLKQSPLLDRRGDPRDEVDDPWAARIRCHLCTHAYAAMEMDRDPAANGAAICAGCAATAPGFHAAAVRDARESTGAKGAAERLAAQPPTSG